MTETTESPSTMPRTDPPEFWDRPAVQIAQGWLDCWGAWRKCRRYDAELPLLETIYAIPTGLVKPFRDAVSGLMVTDAQLDRRTTTSDPTYVVELIALSVDVTLDEMQLPKAADYYLVQRYPRVGPYSHDVTAPTFRPVWLLGGLGRIGGAQGKSLNRATNAWLNALERAVLAEIIDRYGIYRRKNQELVRGEKSEILPTSPQ
jgi:hypothetical protein